jgi:serine/threonine protein phosphatase PrpC
MNTKKNVVTTVAGFTDIGMVRTNNEDNFLIADLGTGRVFLIPQKISHGVGENRLLLAVSDGVGGASSGEVASSMAVHSMRVELLRRAVNSASPFDRLVQAVEKANTLIWNEGQSNPERKGMGATITAALIEGDMIYVAEVGDSRGYVIHKGRIKQVTTDQSLVSVLVNRGLMTPEQAAVSPGRNIILQSLGCSAEIRVAVSSWEISRGDYLLLCSDGLSGKLKADEMCEIVERAPSVEQACKRMIEVAKERGGEDNITIVVAYFDGEGLKPAERVERLTTHIEVLSEFDPDDGSSVSKVLSGNAKESPPASDKPNNNQAILGDRRSKEIEDRPTKRLTAEDSPPQNYLKTMGIGKDQILPSGRNIADITTERLQPVRLSWKQVLDQNRDTNGKTNQVLLSLNQQLECFKHLVYWAERDGKDKQELENIIKNLEDLVREVDSRRLTLEYLNHIVRGFTE